uniref:Uncharacterized protein n=1 Tax=Trichogramma kaykai TaxID=54128 RepID=A0ABD2X8N8_9HYME
MGLSLSSYVKKVFGMNLDSGTNSNASSEASLGTSSDESSDESSDLSSDASSDASFDASSDASFDVSSDESFDASSDASSGTNSNESSDASSDASFDSLLRARNSSSEKYKNEISYVSVFAPVARPVFLNYPPASFPLVGIDQSDNRSTSLHCQFLKYMIHALVSVS